MSQEDDGFHTVMWDDAPKRSPLLDVSAAAANDDDGFETLSNMDDSPLSPPPDVATDQGKGKAREVEGHSDGLDGYEWDGRFMRIEVKDPVKEHEGGKDTHVSYAVCTTTDLSTFPRGPTSVRRRFQDFVFLHDQLVKSFPACIIPNIPDRHRLEYVKGDRFAPEFVEKRRLDLQLFASRIASHPVLQKSQLVNDFCRSEQWSVAKHTHLAHPPDSHTSLIDSLSDTFINAFTRVRKPDARFVEMGEGVDRLEENLSQVERLVARNKNRTDDLSTDYTDLASAFQGLAYLESGITLPLNQFAEKHLDMASLLKHQAAAVTDPFLQSLHSLSSYASAHKAVIKLRDQKQLDVEELAGYAASLSSERDRLAAMSSGHVGAPVGLSTYLKDQVDRLRGTDDIHHRRERMRKLDARIKELTEAVNGAHETSTAFSSQVLAEHSLFELNKQQEMKDALGAYVQGNIDFFQQAMSEYDQIIPILSRIRVDV